MEVKELDTPDLSDPLAQRKVPEKEPSSRPAPTTDRRIDTPRGRFYLEKRSGMIDLRLDDWFILKIGHGKDGKLAFALQTGLNEDSFELGKGTKIREYGRIDDLRPIEKEEEADPHDNGYCDERECERCIEDKFGSDSLDEDTNCTECGENWGSHNGHLCP